MTDDEKYFSLLEAFWCFVDWDSAYDCRSFYSHDFYIKVGGKPANKKITVSERDLNREGEVQSPSDYFVAEIFSAFGFLELTWDDNLQKRPTRYVFPYKDITLSQLGCNILPILMKERKQYLWNRSEDAYDFAFLHSDDDDKEDKDQHKGNFEDVFLPFFKELTIKNRLFPIFRTFIGGRYHLKVALDKKTYRVLALGGNDTFDDLHGAIQDAFDFDDDHLYGFYMSGKRHQGSEVFWSPHYEDGVISADDVKIGEVGLYEGKNFLYYFDFGASWEFSVTVEAIHPDEPEPETLEIIETVGENPEQYEGWDDEDDD
jgi:hypothetical protein